MEGALPEKRLWCSVILQAFDDLKLTEKHRTVVNPRMKRKRYKKTGLLNDSYISKESFGWFMSEDSSLHNGFLNVCFVLKYNHMIIRKKAKSFYAEKILNMRRYNKSLYCFDFRHMWE